MTRDELIDAGARMLAQSRALGHPDRECARRVIETVEPLIRGDERGKAYARLAEARGGRGRIADLRAKVEALPSVMDSNVELVVLADALALIDGYRDGLRDKVLALRTTFPRGSTGGQMSSNLYLSNTGLVRVADVLALLDGDRDD